MQKFLGGDSLPKIKGVFHVNKSSWPSSFQRVSIGTTIHKIIYIEDLKISNLNFLLPHKNQNDSHLLDFFDSLISITEDPFMHDVVYLFFLLRNYFFSETTLELRGGWLSGKLSACASEGPRFESHSWAGFLNLI